MEGLNPVALADELHDGVIQELSALLLQLETYERRLPSDPARAKSDLDRIKLQTRGTLKLLRELVTRLRAV